MKNIDVHKTDRKLKMSIKKIKSSQISKQEKTIIFTSKLVFKSLPLHFFVALLLADYDVD